MAKVSSASVRHLQVFCAAARLSSFKQASQQLFLTPSAVSHRVREPEAELGQFEQAGTACDTALNLALARYGARYSQRDLHQRLALVHANRAILRRVAGDAIAAESDMRKALTLAPRDAMVQASATAFAARREVMATSTRTP